MNLVWQIVYSCTCTHTTCAHALKVNTVTVIVNVSCCHPGYTYESGTCQYDQGNNRIVRPDRQNKYIYLRVSL